MSIFSTYDAQLPGVRHAGRVRARDERQRRPAARPARRDPRRQLPAPALPELRHRVPRRARVHLHGLRRGQYIGVWPVAKRGRVAGVRREDRGNFDEALGKGATARGARARRRRSSRASCSAGRRWSRRSSPGRPASTTARSRWPRWRSCSNGERDADARAARSCAWSATSDGELVLAWVRAADGSVGDGDARAALADRRDRGRAGAVERRCATTSAKAWWSTSSARCWRPERDEPESRSPGATCSRGRARWRCAGRWTSSGTFAPLFERAEQIEANPAGSGRRRTTTR